jgi:hypothetical protein
VNAVPCDTLRARAEIEFFYRLRVPGKHEKDYESRGQRGVRLEETTALSEAKARVRDDSPQLSRSALCGTRSTGPSSRERASPRTGTSRRPSWLWRSRGRKGGAYSPRRHRGTEEMWGAERSDAPRNIGEVALLWEGIPEIRSRRSEDGG